MTVVILYLATAIIFVAIDYVGLSYILKPVFQQDIGHLMRAEFMLGPAALFYAFLVAVVLWFVSWPAVLGGKSLWWVAANAALIGAVAYGTYEFTSLAIMKDWTWRMVAMDVVWGTLLTAVSAAGGVWCLRLIG